MARIYLNNEDIKVLISLQYKCDNEEEHRIIEKILKQSEENRIKTNKIASVYKKNKRKLNKNFARSKNEIKAHFEAELKRNMQK